MIRKILIANRGEIACRIIRTCREMGIASVAVYSDADARALHVEMADEAVHIGASPARESYLNAAAILDAARRTGADAIHPGYGFLAENAAFAQAVIDAGLIWIGPPPKVIEAMGDKRRAKHILSGVPLIPGYSGDDQGDETLIHAADTIGYPIMVKAAAGGGGKGMRRVDASDDLPEALAGARREAKAAFGDDTLILEKYIDRARHVEVQIFGDTHGNVIALGERECSIQRRHQKIIEETPSTALTSSLRRSMFDVSINIGKQIGYVNAGTIEYILDERGKYYFLEVNTRLQVEHPVTEKLVGFDLVTWQIWVAEGQKLPHYQPEDSLFKGHAVEGRVYAEDAANDFLPVSGTVLKWKFPAAFANYTQWKEETPRIDAGVQTGSQVGTYYDPMLAKVIAFGLNRDEAIRRLDYALSQIQLLGIKSNIDFLRRVINHPEFIAGQIDTGFIERHPELLADAPLPPIALIAAALTKTGETTTYWRNNAFRPIRQTFRHNEQMYDVLITPKNSAQIDRNEFTVSLDNTLYEVEVWSQNAGDRVISLDGQRQRVTALPGSSEDWWVHCTAGTFRLDWISPLPAGKTTQKAEGSLRAPMPGQVIKVNVENGQSVSKGDILLVVEAMKMEHRIKAPYAGLVTAVHFRVGETVQAGVTLVDLQASEKA